MMIYNLITKNCIMKKIVVLVLIYLFVSSSLLAQIPLPYFQDFESGVFPPNAWEVFHGSTGNTDWELSPMNVGAESSVYSVLFNNIGVPNTFYVLRCQSLNLTNAIIPVLSFDVAYARYDNSSSDRLSLWYTTNTNGATGWTP